VRHGPASDAHGVAGASGVLVTFVLDRTRAADLGSLERDARELMRAVPEVIGVAANFHDGAAPQILGKETRPLAGATSAPDRTGSSVHFATFGSFVQAHRGQAERIHAILGEAIGISRIPPAPRPGPRVIDLYGGSGSISLGLATAGASVTLVEEFAPAVAQFKGAAHAQGLTVEAVCADVASALRTLNGRRRQFDAAVVNPPRRGTSPAAREELARLGPTVIVYVSCDPETLARDLAHFARLGYETTSLQPLDMIPLTEEVETVAVLRRAVAPTPAVLYDDEGALVVDKSPHEPTTPQADHGGSLLARVRRIAGAEQAVALQQLDVGTSGLVVFARRAEDVAKWRQALALQTTQRSYLAAVRGITTSKGVIARDLREDGGLVSARTRYRRLAIAAGHSLLRIVPDAGHCDQIRSHLASIGHAVLGDERHGHSPTNRYFEEKGGLDRTFLHCLRLEIVSPAAQPVVVEAPLAGDLRAVLHRLGAGETLRSLDERNALGRRG
jgi:23S rRNA (uracil1939-C5)-methyltransferase